MLEQIIIDLDGDFDLESICHSLDELAHQYHQQELIQVYNHLLTVTKEPELLMYLIKLQDKFRDESSKSVLLDLLLMKETFRDNLADRDKYVGVRTMCAKAISNFKDTSTVLPLLYCLNDKDEHYKVRLACAEALGKIGDKYAVAPLIDVVQDEEEKSVYLRESAVLALGMIGDRRAVDPLVSILETKRGILDKFTFLKERALEALSRMHSSGDRVFKALKNALCDESAYIRINAIEALMESEDERASDLIKTMLFDEDEEVKKNALMALYNLEGRDILDEILESEEYCGYLKGEAQDLIDEYESEDGEDYE